MLETRAGAAGMIFACFGPNFGTGCPTHSVSIPCREGSVAISPTIYLAGSRPRLQNKSRVQMCRVVSESPYLNKPCAEWPLLNRRPPGIVTSWLAIPSRERPLLKAGEKGAVCS